MIATLLTDGVDECASTLGLSSGDEVLVCDEMMPAKSERDNRSGEFAELEGWVVVGNRPTPRDLLEGTSVARAFRFSAKVANLGSGKFSNDCIAHSVVEFSSEDEDPAEPEAEPLYEAYSSEAMQNVRGMWNKFWQEAAEFDAFYGECRPDNVRVHEQFRNATNFAPLTCVFAELGAEATGSERTSLESSMGLVLPSGSSDNHSATVQADTCVKEETLLRADNFCSLTEANWDHSPHSALVSCIKIGGTYAGLSRAMRRDGAKPVLRLWCCSHKPHIGKDMLAEPKACSAHCEDGYACGNWKQDSGLNPFGSKKDDAFVSMYSLDASLLAAKAVAPLPRTCSAVPKFEEHNTGYCWACETQRDDTQPFRCSRGRDRDSRTGIETSRRALGMSSALDQAQMDLFQQEAVWRAVRGGMAPSKAQWWTCDETALKDEDGKRAWLGGLMCWDEATVASDRWGMASNIRQTVSGRGCFRWASPSFHTGDEGPAAPGNWTRCSDPGGVCVAKDGDLVRLVKKPEDPGASEDGESVYRVVIGPVPCKAVIFGQPLGSELRCELLSSPANTQSADAAKAEKDVSLDPPRHDGESLKLLLSPLREVPGDASYLYLFDKVFSSQYWRQRAPACAKSPESFDDGVVAVTEM